MKNIFTFLFVFVWFQGTAQKPISEQSTDFIIDKLALTSNPSLVLETTLLDLDITYDIALVNKDYERVSAALREMGAAYYNFGYFNISKDYVWKAKIVAEKYGFNEQNLRCAAWLSKISLKLGDNRASIQFEENYLEILSLIKQESLEASSGQNQMVQIPIAEKEFVKSYEDTASFPLSVIFTALGLIGLLILINYMPIKALKSSIRTEEFQKEKSNKLLDIEINMESLNLIDLTSDDIFDNVPFELVEEKKIEKVKVTPSVKLQAKVVEVELKEDVVVANQKKVESVPVAKIVVSETHPVQKTEPAVELVRKNIVKEEEESQPIEVDDKSYHPKKVQALTQESILAARGNSFYEKTETQKLPMWVSGIEHHFKNVNSIKGIRFDFNYTGDFSLIGKEVHTAFTKFLRAITDELAESDNVQSVSAILVNSSIGLVIQMVARPIHPRNPVLPLKSQDYYSAMVRSSNFCDVIFKESDNGVLKTVLKHIETKRELV